MKTIPQQYVSYSDQLTRLIEPIIEAHDDAESFLFKAQMGMVAWNYCLAQEYQLLPYAKAATTDAFEQASGQSAQWKKWMDQLVRRKLAKFARHSNFIVLADIRDKPDGSQTLYVESAPIEIMMGMLPEQ